MYSFPSLKATPGMQGENVPEVAQVLEVETSSDGSGGVSTDLLKSTTENAKSEDQDETKMDLKSDSVKKKIVRYDLSLP